MVFRISCMVETRTAHCLFCGASRTALGPVLVGGGGGVLFPWRLSNRNLKLTSRFSALPRLRMRRVASCTFTTSCFFIALWFIKHRNIFMYASHLQRAGLVKMVLYVCVRRYLASNLCPVSGCHNFVELVPPAYRSLCGDRL